MLDFDPSADIQALRSTFADIQAVVDVEALKTEIARLSEEAGAPDLWDDVEKAQKVTSALSHRQADLKRVTDVEQRLDDLDVLVELAHEMGLRTVLLTCDEDNTGSRAIIERAGGVYEDSQDGKRRYWVPTLPAR